MKPHLAEPDARWRRLSEQCRAWAIWTADGSLEAYATISFHDAGKNQAQMHLWANGSDHVLYTFEFPSVGFESRWAGLGLFEFSPDHAFVALAGVVVRRRTGSDRR